MLHQQNEDRQREQALMPADEIPQHIGRTMFFRRIGIPVKAVNLLRQIESVLPADKQAVMIDAVYIPKRVKIRILFQQTAVDLPADIVLFSLPLRDLIRPFSPGPDLDASGQPFSPGYDDFPTARVHQAGHQLLAD